jgi:hypothetical protein
MTQSERSGQQFEDYTLQDGLDRFDEQGMVD